MLEVYKKERESTGALLRRFTRKVQQSRILRIVRNIRFRQKPKSRRERRIYAIKRLRMRREKAMLSKLGILNDNKANDRFRK